MDFSDVLSESKFVINKIENFKEFPSGAEHKSKFTFTYMDHNFSMDTIDGKKEFLRYIERI